MIDEVEISGGQFVVGSRRQASLFFMDTTGAARSSFMTDESQCGNLDSSIVQKQ